MSNELEVVAWKVVAKQGFTRCIIEREPTKQEFDMGEEFMPMVRLSDAQAEIAGLKTYAATLAAERDALQAKLDEDTSMLAREWGNADFKASQLQQKLDAANEQIKTMVGIATAQSEASRDALAKELAEAKAAAERYSVDSYELAAIKAQSEPVGYIDAEQLRRWDALRGTAYESEERCYMPFSREPFKSDMSDCSLVVFTHPATADMKDAARLTRAVQAFRNLPMLGNYHKLRATPEYDELCNAWDAAIAKDGKS